MSKYIDAEQLERFGYKLLRYVTETTDLGGTSYSEIIKPTEYPTSDVEKVVRCSDCKYLGVKDFAYGYCKDHMTGILSPNDYCSRGERRDD